MKRADCKAMCILGYELNFVATEKKKWKERGKIQIEIELHMFVYVGINID